MDRQGFSFLLSPDPELIKDRVAELLDGTGFAPRIFWGDEELPADYWQVLTVPSMMGPPNAVVLRRAQERDEEFWSRMDGALAMARPSVWPMFCLESEWKAGKPAPARAVTKGRYWAAARKNGWIWEHPGLSRATIGREVDGFAARHGLTFAPGVRKVLIESLPLATIALRNELEKILLLAGDGGVIRPEYLDTLQPEEPFEIFVFLRELQSPEGRRRAWDTLLNDPAMADGDMVFPISALLVREARLLWRLLHGEESKVQLPPGIKKQKQQLARQLGPDRVARLWDLALRTDTDIKTGRMRPAQALESLVRDAQRLW